MHNIYVNGRFLTQPLSGMQRYAEEMVTAIDRLLDAEPEVRKQFSVVVLAPKGDRRMPNWSRVPIRSIGYLKGHAWEQLELAIHARDGILFNLSGSGPLFHRRSVLVLHDAGVFAHPEHFSNTYGRLHRFLRPRLARRAWRLATVSRFSSLELARYCGVSPGCFTIIGDSAEHILDVEPDYSILTRSGLALKRYILCVGNQSPNKNIALAVDAFARLSPFGYKLAIAGSGSQSVFGNVVETEGDNVVRLGRVTDSELRALYEHAALFLFPSRYEGFGIPPLEAMSLGCPVLSSDSSAMPEVLRDGAAYFESCSLDSLILSLNRALSLIAREEWPVQKGREIASSYSWYSAARTLIDTLYLEKHGTSEMLRSQNQ
jgi:glycosyltransferase involved in cell wall biosynthesis